MSLRDEMRELIAAGDEEALDALVAEEPRAVRYLVGLSYDPDADRRALAGRGLARASHHHETLVRRIVRQLVWAMNDESGTNAVTAPKVLVALAEEQPNLLVPMIPDLFRLSAEAELHDDLAEVLRLVSEACPGEVGAKLGQQLTRELQSGKRAL